MFPVSDVVRDALRGTQTGVLRGVASYQGRQVRVDLQQSGQLVLRAAGEVQGSANVVAFGFGGSLVPKAATDPLATFGQEMTLWRDVTVGGQTWEIPLGVYRIAAASDSTEQYRAGTVLSWSVGLRLMDRFEMLRAGDFLAVDSPVPGNTVWDEIRRLSLFPVAEALTDVAVPPATVYESRLAAIETLCALIGGVPHLTRGGVLTARPVEAWLTATVPAFQIPGVISWSGEMSNDFCNQVQVSNSNDGDITAYAVLDDPGDPLSVQRAGPRTYKHSAATYLTVGEAAAAARTILARVSTRRARTVTVECTPEALLLDLGDVGWVVDPVQGRAVFGEVSAMTVPFDPTRPVTVELIAAEVVDYVPEPDEPRAGAAAGAGFPALDLYPSVNLFPTGGA